MSATIVAKLQKAREIANRIEVLRSKRIDKLCAEAGTGRDGCVIHNAMLSLREGKPWQGINQSKLRELHRVWNTFPITPIMDKLYNRLIAEERANAKRAA